MAIFLLQALAAAFLTIGIGGFIAVLQIDLEGGVAVAALAGIAAVTFLLVVTFVVTAQVLTLLLAVRYDVAVARQLAARALAGGRVRLARSARTGEHAPSNGVVTNGAPSIGGPSNGSGRHPDHPTNGDVAVDGDAGRLPAAPAGLFAAPHHQALRRLVHPEHDRPAA